MNRRLCLSSWSSLLLLNITLSGACFSDDLLSTNAKTSRSFEPAERRRIDDNALWGPRELINKPDVEATASVVQWLVVHAAIPADEERQRGEDEIKAADEKWKPSPAPAAAEKVFDALIEALPNRMRPNKWQAGIVVVEKAERVAQIAGLGRVYLDKSWLDAVLADERTGRDQLAFVLAHDLSHVSLGHTRRRYQLRWLEPHFHKDIDRQAKLAFDPQKKQSTKELLGAFGAISENVYTREESYQSDLFAIQLSRNAGFDVENGLDVLRAEAVGKNKALLNEPPPREGTPPVEPEIQPNTTRESLTLANPPTAADRLRRLRLELDGLIFGEFGLFEFDRGKKSFERAGDKSLPADAPAVVCIHGMESSRGVWQGMLTRLADETAKEAAPRKLFAFQYPADDSLGRAGRFLQRELRRVCGNAKQVDFVVHSAGGLVFRWYAEVEQGEFRRAVFLGTPHQGSDLARLRGLLEAKQFLGDISLGFDSALQNAILDGRGQITFDLAPNSLFLSFLNRERPDLHRDRYAIHRGKALSSGRALVLKTSVDAARAALNRQLKKEQETLLMAFGATALDTLTVPPEIFDGDLCVTSDSALLSGVKSVETHSLSHTSLPRNDKVISLVVERLLANP
jgi:pimeloyl-ACP methyl ester carboxylesterase